MGREGPRAEQSSTSGGVGAEGLSQGGSGCSGVGIFALLPKAALPHLAPQLHPTHARSRSCAWLSGEQQELGEEHLDGMFQTAQGTLPIKSQAVGKIKEQRSFQVCGWRSVCREASQGLKGSSEPSPSPDTFPRLPQGFLKVFSRFSFQVFRDFKDKLGSNRHMGTFPPKASGSWSI